MLPLLHLQLHRHRHPVNNHRHPVNNHRHRLPMGLQVPQEPLMLHRLQRTWMHMRHIGAFRTFQGPESLLIDNTQGCLWL